MSRSPEDWEDQKKMIVRVRNKIHRAIDELDYYAPFIDHDAQISHDLEEELFSAAKKCDLLIGFCTKDYEDD